MLFRSVEIAESLELAVQPTNIGFGSLRLKYAFATLVFLVDRVSFSRRRPCLGALLSPFFLALTVVEHVLLTE